MIKSKLKVVIFFRDRLDKKTCSGKDNGEISTRTRPRAGSVSAQNEVELVLSGRTTTGGGTRGEKGTDGRTRRNRGGKRMGDRSERARGGWWAPRGLPSARLLNWE